MRNLWRILGILLFISVMGLIWTSFRGREKTHPTKHTYTIGLLGPNTITTLDPAQAINSNNIFLISLLYDRLLWVDNNGTLHPQFAISWGSKNNGKTWYIVIRKDRMFHETKKHVTAEDLARSIERSIAYPSYGQTLLGPMLEGAQDYINKKATHIRGLKVHEDTLFFNLTHPSKHFLFRLATTFFVPVDPTTIKDESPWIDRGSGPYRLMKRVQSENLFVLVKTWKHLKVPAADTLIIRLYQNPLIMIEDFSQGKLDLAYPEFGAIRQIPKELFTRGEVHLLPTTTIYELFINLKDPLMQRREIRLAISRSIDRKSLVRFLGGGIPLCSPVLFTTRVDTSCFSGSEIQFPDKVNVELLHEGGDMVNKIATALRDQLQQSNIQLTVVAQPGKFFDQILKGDFQLALTYYGPFVPHPEPYLRIFLSSSIPVPNIMHYQNLSFDKSYAMYELQEDESALNDALNALLQDLPVIPLFRVVLPELKKKYVIWEMDAANVPILKE